MDLTIHDTIPCWYTLRLDWNQGCFVIGVHEDFITSAPPPFNTDIIRASGHRLKFSQLKVNIPVIRTATDHACTHCQADTQADCPLCYGSGKQHTTDWKAAKETVEALSVLFEWLNKSKYITNWNPQYIMVRLNTGNNANSEAPPIYGVFGYELTAFLQRPGSYDTAAQHVEGAMRLAYQKLFGVEHTGFRLKNEGGVISIGDPEIGYHLTGYPGFQSSDRICHTAKCLVLLAGLSALYQAATS